MRDVLQQRISRAEEQIAGKLQNLDLAAMFEKERALLTGAHARRRAFIEAQLMADDPDPADINGENNAARQHAEQERLQESEYRCDQHDRDDDQPIEHGKMPEAEHAPIP